MRAYTPICAPEARGHFTLALKVYRANVHKGFPQGGAMSQYLDNLQVMSILNLELWTLSRPGRTRVRQSISQHLDGLQVMPPLTHTMGVRPSTSIALPRWPPVCMPAEWCGARITEKGPLEHASMRRSHTPY